MHDELLAELQRTNEILIRLSVLITIGVMIWVLRNCLIIWRQGRGLVVDRWRDHAQNLWEKGKNEKLLQTSIQRVRDEPKSALGYYWKARAERELGLVEDLKQTLAQLKELQPSWVEDWMEPYLESKSE